MKKPIHYRQITFRQDILFFIGWKREEVERYARKNLNCQIDLSDCYGSCITISYENRDPIMLIWNYSKKRSDITVHECVHGANKILKLIGNISSHSNDEVIAYLTQELYSVATQKKI